MSIYTLTETLEPAEALETTRNGVQMSAYINAGGRGRRLQPMFLASETLGISKALLEIGQPSIALIDHQINKLLDSDVRLIVAGVGDHLHVARHLKQRYADHIGIFAVGFEKQLGTGGDLVRAVREYPDVFAKQLYITNTDVLLDINEQMLFAFHEEHNAIATIAVTQTSGVPNENAYAVGIDDQVVDCMEVSLPFRSKKQQIVKYHASSTGALIFDTEFLQDLPWKPGDGTLSLYSDVIGRVIMENGMFAFNNGCRLFTDVGTVASWQDLSLNFDNVHPYIHYQEPEMDYI